jgi:hypothetical protein
MLEIEDAQKEGRLVEAFTSGTAVCVFAFFCPFLLPFLLFPRPEIPHFPFHSHKGKEKENARLPTNTPQYFVTPVSAINFRAQEIDIPMSEGDSGLYAKIIKGWLYDIMYGNVQHEWGVVIDENE